MDSDQFAARPEAMRSAVGNVGGIIMRASGTLAAFELQAADPVSFAAIGSAVGTANARLQLDQVSALHSLFSLLQGVSSLVQRSADGYQSADAAVAVSYGGRGLTRTEPRIWSALAGAALADQAMGDSRAGAAPHPYRADSLIGYLAAAGLGQLGTAGQGGPLSVPIGSAGDLTAWLADNPANQAQLGLIAVYEGAARGLDGTPGGLHPGDVVFIEPRTDAADQQVTVGVVGSDGDLHNHGRLPVDLGAVARVQVYRPVTTEQVTPACS
jgi:hypothetical protein